MTKKKVRRCIRICLLAAAAVLAAPAYSATIFSENFNALTGTAGGTEPTERRSGTLLSGITLPGWTFEGDAGQIFGHDAAGDKAVWLNEVGGASQAISRTIGGLTPGALHTLAFEYWGDNNASEYSFNYEINGTVTGVGGTGRISTDPTGNFHTVMYQFTPSTASTVLRFAETSASSASPVFDNLTLSVTAVPEPSTWAFLLVGLGIVGIAARRRKEADDSLPA